MSKIKIFCLGILFILIVNSTNSQIKLKEHFSIKMGHSLSVTQWGLSPLSETRRLEDRSINAVFFNIQYALRFKKQNFNVGLQLIQKGFQTTIERKRQGSDQTISYEHRLFYLELPINYVFKHKKTSIISGLVFSYLYDDLWRFSDVQVIYDKFGNIAQTFNSNYSSKFPFFDRYNAFDFGLNLGFSRQINKSLDFEFSIQKHFINVDNWKTLDLRYNLCFLTGLRYKPF